MVGELAHATTPSSRRWLISASLSPTSGEHGVRVRSVRGCERELALLLLEKRSAHGRRRQPDERRRVSRSLSRVDATKGRFITSSIGVIGACGTPARDSTSVSSAMLFVSVIWARLR